MGRFYVSVFQDIDLKIFFFHFQQVDRLWRKNRRPVLSVGSVNIIGVDLNRNFPNENWGAYSFSDLILNDSDLNVCRNRSLSDLILLIKILNLL